MQSDLFLVTSDKWNIWRSNYGIVDPKLENLLLNTISTTSYSVAQSNSNLLWDSESCLSTLYIIINV